MRTRALRTSLAVGVAVLSICARPARCEEQGPHGYGAQMGMVDAASAITLFVGLAARDSAVGSDLLYLGLATYGLGGPIVHWTHDRVGRGFGSLALRTLLPMAAGFVGAEFAGSCGGQDECYNALIGGAIGVLAGGLTAMLLDDLWLAHEDAAREPPQRLAIGFTRKAMTLAVRF